MTNDNTLKLEAVITDKIPNGHYIVKTVEPELEIVAHVSGKMRLNHIRIFPGDRVLVELTSNDLTHGRIVYALKKRKKNIINNK